MVFFMIFVCPKCKNKLNINGGCAVCERGHSFDRAKEGYYNLLLGVSGGTHGDNKEMVQARRDFLARGYYRPLADRIAALASAHLPDGAVLLDAGCGEGYYTDLVERRLSADGRSHRMLAFDISKDAVRPAAKRNKEISFAVASSYDIPLADGSVDGVMNVFSPMALDETRRVLKDGGLFIFVYPDEDHLFALKKLIYTNPYKNEPQDTALDGFDLLGVEKVFYDMEIGSGEDLRALFMMTPYAYRTGREERERLNGAAGLVCEARFCIAVYRKA